MNKKVSPKGDLTIRVNSPQEALWDKYTVKARAFDEKEFETVSFELSDDGESIRLMDLPQGKYEIRLESEGFEPNGFVLKIGSEALVAELHPVQVGTPYLHARTTKFPFQKTLDREILYLPTDLSAAEIDEVEKILKKQGVKLIDLDKSGNSATSLALSKDKLTPKSRALIISEIAKTLKKPVEIAPLISGDQNNPVLLTKGYYAKINKGFSLEDVKQALSGSGLRYERPDDFDSRFCFLEGATASYDLLAQANQLSASEVFEYVNPILASKPIPCAPVFPADALFPQQWHLRFMRLPEAWDLLDNINVNDQLGSADVIMAAQDTGMSSSQPLGNATVHNPGAYNTRLFVALDPLPAHSDFRGNVVGGNLSAKIGNTRKTYYSYDYNTQQYGMVPQVNPVTDSHGTSVLGIMGAASDGATGVVGMAPNARLMSMGTINGVVGVAQAGQFFQFTSGFFPGWAPVGAGSVPAPFGTAPNIGPGADIINLSYRYNRYTFPNIGQPDGVALAIVTKFGRNRRGTLIFSSSGNYDKDYRTEKALGPDNHVMIVSASSLDFKGYESRTPYASFSLAANGVSMGIDFCGLSNSLSRAGANNYPIGHPPAIPFAVPAFPAIVTTNGAYSDPSVPLIFVTAGVLAAGANNVNITNAANAIPLFPNGSQIVITAAGNPAIFHLATVTATTAAGNIAFAPAYPMGSPAIPAGSSVIGHDYTTRFNGTSASSPTVAGVAALVITAKKTLTWMEVRQILRSTSDPIAPRHLGIGGRTGWIEIDPAGLQTSLLTPQLTMALSAVRLQRFPNFAPLVPAGSTQINIGNTAGFAERDAILIGVEVLLTNAPAAGTDVLILNETAGLAVGMNLLIGNDYETCAGTRSGHLVLAGTGGAIGSNYIYVQDVSGFAIGDTITINPGQPTAETVTITAFPGGMYSAGLLVAGGGDSFTIRFAPALAFNHNRGERIISANREVRQILNMNHLGNPLAVQLSANLTNGYPAGTVVRQQNSEVRLVRRIVSGSVLEIDPLEYPKSGNFKIERGRRADYSHGFGHGRVNAEKAVAAAIAYTHNERDLVIRNFLADDGITNRIASPTHSPDIWSTNLVATAPGALLYADAPPHENPRLSLSSAVFAGTGINDLEVLGTFSGPAAATYEIRISSTGANDQFTWSKNGGAPSAATNILAAGNIIDIAPNQFTIKFGAITGHAVNDRWLIQAEPITRFVHIRAKNRGSQAMFAPPTAPAFNPMNTARAYLALSDGSPVKRFMGTGQNDLFPASDYTGATKDIFTILIDTIGGASDTFVWAKGRGAFSAPVAINASATHLLSDGVSIRFTSHLGHTRNEVWVLRCYPAAQKYLNVDHYIEAEGRDTLAVLSSNPGTHFIGETTLPVLADNTQLNCTAYVNTNWQEDRRPPRNKPGVAPPARPLRTFLMGEALPHDGALAGDTPADNNNISYREVMFARFLLQKQNGYEKFDNYIEVDGIGTEVTKPFKLVVVADAGSFKTETIKVMLEIDLEAGGTEIKEFSYNTGTMTWGFVGGMPTWATMVKPKVNTTTFPDAAGEQTQIVFEGTLKVKNAHQRVRIKPQIYSTVNTTQVVADQTFTVPVYELAVLPSSRYTGLDATALVPSSHFFTDHALLQLQTVDEAYGPINTAPNDKFRCTSLFKATAGNDPFAYAVVNGFVMVQRDPASPDTVNLILKPFTQAMLGFTPVKYFIYRGIILTDILKGNSATDELLVHDFLGASPWVKDLWIIHNNQNPGLVPFESKALGYAPSLQPGVDLVDQWFFRNDPDFQLPYAAKGVQLGRFNGSPASGNPFGFEIVLEEGDAQLDYDYVRKYKHEIDLSALPCVTPAEIYAMRLRREEILRYMDPAAFYGMHMAKDGKVKVSGPLGEAIGADIYTDLISPIFLHPNRMYVDIRNEVGASYNFYDAYNDGSGNALKVGIASGSLTAQPYATNLWPILIRDNSASPGTHTNLFNEVWLKLRLDYNHDPFVYVDHGSVISVPDKKVPRYISRERLYTGASPAETLDIGLSFPNYDPGTGSKYNVPWILKLHYGMRLAAANVPFPPKVLPAVTTVDNLFGPIDLATPWTNGQDIAWTSAQDNRFVDAFASNSYAYMADRGVATQGNGATARTLFYLTAVSSYKEQSDLLPQPNYVPYASLSGGTSKKDSIFAEEFFNRNFNVAFDAFKDGATEVISLNLVRDPQVPFPEETLVLMGITKAELDTLKALTGGITSQWQRHICLLPVVGSPFTDAQGKTFQKFRTGISGLDVDGNAMTDMPTVDIYTYSVDGLFHFTKAYTDLEPPVPYERNFEEAVGAMKATTAAQYSVGSFAGSTFTILGIDLRREIRVGDRVAYETNGVSYNVTAVNYVGSDTQVVVNTAIVVAPGSTLGDLVPAIKAFEDYFIDKDYEGAISGTTQMRTIVNGFKASVAAVPNNAAAVAAIQAIINTEAPKILARGRALCAQNSYTYPDDRILYWARIAMVVAVKSHPALLTRFSDRNTLVQSLEIKSRGHDSVTFAGAPVGAKKLLISGFDPFQLNPDPQLGNINRSNPSGAIALALHGKTLPGNIYVQSAMFPVRYRDFDENGDGSGVVEDFFKKFLDPGAPGYQAVDMIITLSQGQPMRFDLERFAGRYREGAKDNENRPITAPPAFKIADTLVGDEYYETELPVAKMVVPPIHSIFKVVYDQTFKYVKGAVPFEFSEAKSIGLDPLNPGPAVVRMYYTGVAPGSPAIVVNMETLADKVARGLTADVVVPNQLSELTNPKKSEIKSRLGSQSAYLSNEIFYRVARLRETIPSATPTGHYHVPRIQGIEQKSIDADNARFGLTGADQMSIAYNPALMRKLIEQAEDSLKKALTP